MADQYIVLHDDTYFVAGTRVSLDSVVIAFLDGAAAEAISQSFPVLTLEQVYGAIAYYLAHRDAVDEYLHLREDAFERARRVAREADPAFVRRLAATKKLLSTAR
ncbi:MAG TPA: DUF433 domain-containing protein [Vicinamibacterales bacterium]|nr:DUF433 domain-containing protein [Vicinamibacterales bacterium]